jgi:DNA-binding response OmpR family regulator
VIEEPTYFREIAQEALAARFEVRVASTIAEAERALAAGGFDLIILDPQLGAGAGAALLRRLGAKPCPILLYTAQDESEMYGKHWDELQALGADDIVIAGMQSGESLARKAASLLGRPSDDEA